MNETISLNPRQKTIINILAQNTQLSREEITQQLSTIYPVSKATLARDLAYLQKIKKILALGQGPSRTYKVIARHPLLKWVDLDQYFIADPDSRKIPYRRFNPKIYTNLDHLISLDEQAKLKLIYRSFSHSFKKLSQSIRRRELERFVIELSWKSSKIEGNTYSLLETEKLIKEAEEAPGHLKSESIMILNHKHAFNTILRYKDNFRKLSLSNVLELHNVLVKDLGVDTGIRKHAVGITGTAYLPPDNEWQIKEFLEKLIKVVNNIDYPLNKALVIIGMVSYLQPFADGNKRTARMLANAVLLAHDYYPLSYRSVDKSEFKRALILIDETNNFYHLKRLFLDQYRFALKTYFI